MGVESIPPSVFMSIRFMIAVLLILPFALYTWKPLSRRDFLHFTFGSLLYISVSALALNIGLTKTSASNAGVIWLLGPLVLFALSAAYLKEQLSFRTFMGIMVALAGSLIIIGRPGEGAADASDGLTGNLLIVIAVFGSTIAMLIFKPLMRKVSAYQATFLSLFPGIIPITIYALTQFHTWDISATTTKSIEGLVYGTVAVVLANFLLFYALRYKKAQSTGVYQYLDPLATILGAWFLLSERPSSKFAVGALLVFLGVYIAESRKRHAQETKQST